MSFAVSLDDGRLEYGGHLPALFAQPKNICRPTVLVDDADLARFYRHAPADQPRLGAMPSMPISTRAASAGRSATITSIRWRLPSGRRRRADIGAYPAAAFIRFSDNHGLLKLTGRPVWRTVAGGSRVYVERLMARFRDRIEIGNGRPRRSAACRGAASSSPTRGGRTRNASITS